MRSIGLRAACDRRFRRTAITAVMGFFSSQLSMALAVQEVPPTKDRTLTAEQPQMAAHFGYTMAMGKLGQLAVDTQDDLVVCAIHEDEGPTVDIGAAYLFEDEDLNPAPLPRHRLLAKSPVDHPILMGQLKAEIGNVRGPGFNNLLLLGAVGRRAEYPQLGGSVRGGGSVEVFDVLEPSFAGQAQLTLVAPPSTPGQIPAEVKQFGHGVALGDVTNDGVLDVAVGAPDTETVWGAPTPFDPNNFGRLYLFEGHAAFLSNPYATWVGINAPQPDDGTKHLGSTFGPSVLAVDLDADNNTEIVVGRTDRYDRMPNTPSESPGGSTYVFRAFPYLHDLLNGPSANGITDPPTWPAGLTYSMPEYQLLLHPFKDQLLQLEGPDWFGWQLHAVGDIGTHDGGPPDGFPDIAVHSEGTDFIGSETLEAPQVLNAGGLFVYFGVDPNDASWSPKFFVYPAHVLLMRPANVGLPEQNARYSRAVAGVQWLDSDQSSPTYGQVAPALLVSEPDATVGTDIRRGQVFLLRPPLCPTAPLVVCQDPVDTWPELRPAPTKNAWIGGPLIQTEAGLSEGFHPLLADFQLFGSEIVVGDFKADPVAFPGQQFVVSSRNARVVEVDSDGQTIIATHDFAGAAFSYLPPDLDP